MPDDARTPLPRAALILNAGAFALPVALGSLFAALLKTINPSGVDVSQELAYLRPILIVGFVLVAVFVLAAVVVDIVLSSRRHPFAPALWTILGVQVLGIMVFVVARLWEGAITGG